MKSTRVLARISILIALGYGASYLPGVPFIGAKLFPVQHAINVVAAVMLGPWYAMATALCIAVLRIMTGTGSPLAIPGSIFGALIAGMVYRYTKSRVGAVCGEVLGTGVIGAIASYPVAVWVMGSKTAAAGGVTVYMFSFTASSLVGALLGIAAVAALHRSGSVAESQ